MEQVTGSGPAAAPSGGSFAALVGIDWADQQHAVALCDRAVSPAGSAPPAIEHAVLPQTPEALEQWALKLRERFAGKLIAVAVEQSRGPLIYALMKYPWLVIHPLPPARLASYRKAFVTSGAKDDPTDADLILDYLAKHRDQLRPWRPGDAATRKLALLVEQRRNFVDQRTALSNQLTAQLRGNPSSSRCDWRTARYSLATTRRLIRRSPCVTRRRFLFTSPPPTKTARRRPSL